jgi:hypothetical protein
MCRKRRATPDCWTGTPQGVVQVGLTVCTDVIGKYSVTDEAARVQYMTHTLTSAQATLLVSEAITDLCPFAWNPNMALRPS